MDTADIIQDLKRTTPELFERVRRYQEYPSAPGDTVKYHTINHDPRILGVVSAYSPFSVKVSSSRNAMVTNQKGQAIVIKEPEIPRILHGYETQEAEYCFGAKAPCDMYVLDVVKCRQGDRVVLTTVIYEDEETGEINSLDINPYERYHDTFGFELELTDVGKSVSPTDRIPKGTFLTKTRSTIDGIYSPGVNAQVCYITHTGVIEDGFVVSESFMKKLTGTATGSRSFDFGTDWYPLNLYGDATHYKPYPAPGERVRDDGILMAFRKRDPLLDCINMTPEALMTVDLVNDKVFYTDSNAKNALVYRVDVIDSENEGARQSIPPAMVGMVKQHARQWSAYHENILRFYYRYTKELRANGNEKANFAPRFTKKVYDALVDRPNDADRNYGKSRGKAGKITRTSRGDQLNEFRVEIHFAYDFELSESAKLTDFYGGKGVIVGIMPDEDMPTYPDGTRADVLVYFRSGVARSNPGQFVEQYITANARDFHKTIVAKMDSGVPAEELYATLHRYYSIVAPKSAMIFASLPAELKHQQLMDVYQRGIYLTILAADDHIVPENIVDELEAFQPTTRMPVTYRNLDGEMVTTKVPVLIGSKYMIVLDKSDPKPMSISIGRLQHHRLPAKPNRGNRYSTPVKEQAPRAFGETEGQVVGAVVGDVAMADIIDITTNPEATTEATINIAEADNPSSIDVVVSRDKVPLGNSSSQVYVNNLFSSYGIKLYREDD